MPKNPWLRKVTNNLHLFLKNVQKLNRSRKGHAALHSAGYETILVFFNSQYNQETQEITREPATCIRNRSGNSHQGKTGRIRPIKTGKWKINNRKARQLRSKNKKIYMENPTTICIPFSQNYETGFSQLQKKLYIKENQVRYGNAFCMKKERKNMIASLKRNNKTPVNSLGVLINVKFTRNHFNSRLDVYRNIELSFHNQQNILDIHISFFLFNNKPKKT